MIKLGAWLQRKYSIILVITTCLMGNCKQASVSREACCGYSCLPIAKKNETQFPMIRQASRNSTLHCLLKTATRLSWSNQLGASLRSVKNATRLSWPEKPSCDSACLVQNCNSFVMIREAPRAIPWYHGRVLHVLWKTATQFSCPKPLAWLHADWVTCATLQWQVKLVANFHA